MSQIKGKVAIVTGSTSGIGFGIAKVLLKTGARVILNGMQDKSELNTVFDELSSFGEFSYFKADLSQVDQIEKLVNYTLDTFSSVDILVNNAGIQYVSPCVAFPTEKWNQILALNLTAVFHMTRLVLSHMNKKKWGRIINIASAHGLVASPNKAAYVAAKHGVVGLTKVVGLEYAGKGITCNAICPGWVLTPLVQAQIDKIANEKGISNEDAVQELLSEKQPSLQFASPEQIGEMVNFLCTDAAMQITGTALPIDGGWTAR